jgi:hypothetical protein
MRRIGSLTRRSAVIAVLVSFEAGLVTAAHAQVDIPLQLLGFNPTAGRLQPVGPSNSNVDFYRLGISVGIGGGAPQTYLFDTGSSAFNAALAPAAMPTQTLTSLKQGFTYSYTSGATYILNQFAVPSLNFYPTSSSAQPVVTLSSPSSGYQVNFITEALGNSNYFDNHPTAVQGPRVLTIDGNPVFQDTSFFPKFDNKGLPPIEGGLFASVSPRW